MFAVFMLSYKYMCVDVCAYCCATMGCVLFLIFTYCDISSLQWHIVESCYLYCSYNRSIEHTMWLDVV